jgi:hypothetical protein
MVGERFHFARRADTVAVRVAPERQAFQFAIANLAVAVVVKGRERLEAVPPEQPERHVAEELQRRLDLPGPLRIANEPGRILRDPRPRSDQSGAVRVECHGVVEIDDLARGSRRRQRDDERSNRSRKPLELRGAALQVGNLFLIAIRVEERNQVRPARVTWLSSGHAASITFR